jgi:hypothetical protein
MPELDDPALERRLRGVLQEHLGALPLDLTVVALDRRREAKVVARRSGRGRSMTLLAAAALLLVGGALAAGSGLLRMPSVIPPLPAPSVVAVATASPDATSASPSESAAPSASPIAVAGPRGIWIPTGSMVTPRSAHAAVRLLDGRVLVVGGHDGQTELISAELYDPVTGTWSAAGSISMPIVAATLLRDGKVLVLVGDPNGGPRRAEVYDPAGGTWTATGPMVRDPGVTYTVLRDGRVLVAGGDGAQVYDPANGTWTATGRMNDQGYRTTATLLSDGKVLVAGGKGFRGGDEYYLLDSAQVYDPATGSWTAIASMHAKAQTDAAFLQPDGKVLVVGSAFGPSFHAEVYDPAIGTWTELPVRPGVRYRTAAVLSDGAVLVTGETDADQPACTADLYDPRTGSWTTASSMLGCDGDLSFTLLVDGTVLAAGSSHCNSDGVCATNGTAALYVPAGVALPPLPAFPSPAPPVFPSPTPVPTPLPPAAGPVPPNARSWAVTVDNQSSQPAALFVADEAWDGLRLVGSATPNVVAARTTVQVTFRFPADGGWIYVNPRPGEGGSLVNADQIGIPGKIVITADGQVVWASP